MASAREVEQLVEDLAARLAALDPEVRRRYVVERTVSCTVADLARVVSARLTDDGLVDVVWSPTSGAPERAQVRLALASDDLLALAEGRLGLATAFATGRLRIQAGPMDLLRLRTLL